MWPKTRVSRVSLRIQPQMPSTRAMKLTYPQISAFQVVRRTLSVSYDQPSWLAAAAPKEVDSSSANPDATLGASTTSAAFISLLAAPRAGFCHAANSL
jgi:hypothetical protein